MLHGVTYDRLETLGAIRAAWDDLAVRLSRPYCAPAWMLAWWKHVAPPSARLRVRALFDGNELVGVAPFFADRGVAALTRYRLLAAGTSSPLDILAREGMEDAVADDASRFLAGATPTPGTIMLEGLRAPSPWPELLAEHWPRGAAPTVSRQYTQPAPYLRLGGAGRERWLAAQSAHARHRLRRDRRAVETAGATIRLSANDDELARDLGALARLHYARWRARGGSSALDAGIERMLLEAGRELLPLGRFQLWALELDARVISAHLLVGAGNETAYAIGGFDEEEPRIRRPAVTTLVFAVEHAFETGDGVLDFGPGAQRYKYELASDDQALEWVLLVPHGWRSGLAHAQLARQRARQLLAQRLPPGAKRIVRRALAVATRLRGG